jgi:hypothetical protein
LYFELLPELLKDCNRPVSASITGIKRVSWNFERQTTTPYVHQW